MDERDERDEPGTGPLLDADGREVAWHCAWHSPGGIRCEAGGPFAQRTPARTDQFHRHVCYGGHGDGRPRDTAAPPVIYIICFRHYHDWAKLHGTRFALDRIGRGVVDVPDWLRHDGYQREYDRARWPSRVAESSTRISSRTGNG